MKKLNILFLIIFSPFLNYAQSEATLEETIDWIEGQWYSLSYSIDEFKWSVLEYKISITKCDCEISTQVKNDAGSFHSIKKTTDEFNFGKLSLSTEVDLSEKARTSSGPLYNLGIDCFNGLKNIKTTRETKYVGIDMEEPLRTSYNSGATFFSSSDKELVGRMQTAVEHMIKLCGG